MYLHSYIMNFSRPCAFCRNVGHHINYCPNVTCKNCKKLGHTASVCSEKKKNPQTESNIYCSYCKVEGHNYSHCRNPQMKCRNCGKSGHGPALCGVQITPPMSGVQRQTRQISVETKVTNVFKILDRIPPEKTPLPQETAPQKTSSLPPVKNEKWVVYTTATPHLASEHLFYKESSVPNTVKTQKSVPSMGDFPKFVNPKNVERKQVPRIPSSEGGKSKGYLQAILTVAESTLAAPTTPSSPKKEAYTTSTNVVKHTLSAKSWSKIDWAEAVDEIESYETPWEDEETKPYDSVWEEEEDDEIYF